ncbi:MAG: YggS family pyridoxal phosphate-dependent enzyme [Cellulomonadaceae bacterium]
MSTSTADRIAAARERIARASDAVGRDPGDVRLLLATKTMPADVVLEAVRAGADLIGENRVQELAAKGPALDTLAERPQVHLIGHLQSNKVNAALRWADCLETIDTLALAERVARRCHAESRVLDVMVQVNTSDEPTKSGVPPEQAAELADAVAEIEGLRLRGFMTIGANSDDEREVRASYARLRAVRDEVAGRVPSARELSMGMSRDFPWAVAEGATIVRLGTAVFGPRS